MRNGGVCIFPAIYAILTCMKDKRSVVGRNDPLRGMLRDSSLRVIAAQELVRMFQSSPYVDSNDKNKFECFVDWLSVNRFYREDFGQHFVDAWNEEKHRYSDPKNRLKPEESDSCCMKYLKPAPPPGTDDEDEDDLGMVLVNSKEIKEMESQEKSQNAVASSFGASIVTAAIILALGAIAAAFIIRSRPLPVQHRFEKLNAHQILNVETGEVTTCD